jgi:leucyl-tRNA synthetase
VEAKGDKFIYQGSEVERIVAKMSKSLRNVTNPGDVIQEYGADTMRLYEAFMGPITASAPWNPRDLPGAHRFLQRAWRLFEPEFSQEPNGEIEKALHAAMKKTTQDIEQMANNTAIAALMEFVNSATKSKATLTQSQGERFALLLEPFAPHLAEEMWKVCGHADSCAWVAWPEWEESLLVSETIEIPVQINGKLRGRITVDADAQPDTLEAAAKEAIADLLAGKTIKKAIVVPGRMVNLVVG